jgi:hypothetical protein
VGQEIVVVVDPLVQIHVHVPLVDYPYYLQK